MNDTSVSDMVVSRYCEFNVRGYTHQAAMIVDGRWMVTWLGWMVRGQFAYDPQSRRVTDLMPPAYPEGQ